jgi:protein gp37
LSDSTAGTERSAAARVRFISYEPALGPIDVGPYLSRDKLFSLLPGFRDPMGGVNWVIAGGESGPRARPAHPDWFGRVRDQCKIAGVPFLFKQWGEFAPNARTFAQIADSGRAGVPVPFFPDRPGIISPKYPTAIMDRVGKKAAGRELDGRTWNEFPA